MIKLFRDVRGCQGRYKAVSVIEYSGRLSATGGSSGHYTCDVRESKSGLWFKTNDITRPIQIQVSHVSKSAYVVLFKRT